jgi:hypothetical protein
MQGDDHMIISRSPCDLRRLDQTTDHRDHGAHHNRRGGAPLTGSVLAELAIGDRSELHSSSMDQIDAGVLRDCGEAGHPRYDLEVDTTPYACCGLVGDSVVQERITSDEPHHSGTGRSLLEYDLGARGRAQWLASFGQAEREYFGTIGQRDGWMSQDLLLPIIVQDH